MLNWWRNRQLDKQTKWAEDARLLEELKIIAISEAFNLYAEAVQTMLSKPCPHRGDKKCRTKCVHFQQGSHNVYWAWDDSGYFPSVREPKCKLWK